MDDWDENTTHTSVRLGGGFGRGFGRGSITVGSDEDGGFGRGFGRARGKPRLDTVSPNPGGFGSNIKTNGFTSGFGGRGFGESQGGFQRNQGGFEENEGDVGGGRGDFSSHFRRGGDGFRKASTASDNWEDNCKAPGFGSGTDRTEERSSRGSGFGGRKFLSAGEQKAGGCYHCGDDDHLARECPQKPGGASSGQGCHRCGEEGHFARECPKGGGGGRGGRGGREGGSGCRKCGEDGHFARECPQNLDDNGQPREAPYVPPPPPEGEDALFEQSVQKGINFTKYDNIPVEVTGNNKPSKGLHSFDEADISETIRSNIRKAKYTTPTPIQKWAIPIIMNKRDLMGCAQTGSGKTAAFLLPVLTSLISDGMDAAGQYAESQTPNVVIVGPTRELVIQIWKDALKFSHGTIIRPRVVYGGTSVMHQCRQIDNGAHVIVGTPGRLLDFISRGKISLAKVRYLILDEADRMLDMGFEGEVRKLVGNHDMPPKEERQTLMFSATFPEEIQKMARDFLNDYVFVTVGRVGGANTDITQTVHEVTQFDKREKLVSILNQTGKDRTLVFVEQKRQADFLASFLSQSQFPTTSIHGDRLQREREEALRDFTSGRAPILVATSVAARGLDIPNVMHVVNFDMPLHIEEYVHRIGRTGRCGNTGKATSFFDPARDGDIARALVKVLADAQQEVPTWLEEAAEGAFGQGFGEVGGKFGGRDTRRGRFGASRGGFGASGGRRDDFNMENSNGFTDHTNMISVDADDEDWD